MSYILVAFNVFLVLALRKVKNEKTNVLQISVIFFDKYTNLQKLFDIKIKK